MYLYLGTIFRVPVPAPVPGPHEQGVGLPGTCTWWQNTCTIQVHVRYIYDILNIIIYRILNIHTNQVSEF